MKVLIDTKPLNDGNKMRGVGQYTNLLVEALRVQENDDFRLVERVEEADLVHYPYFDFFRISLPFTPGLPFTVTVHDVIPLVFPNAYKPGLKGAVKLKVQKLLLSGSKVILTDSESSRQDIGKYLNQPLSKVKKVYLAAAPDFKPLSARKVKEVKESLSLPHKYALYVGDINYNKNLVRLIEAVASTPSDLFLVMVSRAMRNDIPESRHIRQVIADHGLQKRVIILTEVPLDPIEIMVGIYNGALFYIQPSLYEGFGLPVLEAMQSGTPVLASNTSSLPEVGGNAPFYFDPYDVPDISRAINVFLEMKDDDRQKMTELGHKQAKEFDWEKTARETIAGYQKALEG